jgi:SAM-dependent methyltransferase
MLPSSHERIQELLSDDDIVLDVGGWANPYPRADWVIDLMPYETRGLYGERDSEPGRFGPETWVERDICDREPWPFGDDQFDFALCSHTLEDVRDPVWVCSELTRIAKAGYVEVPSRLEEQSYGIHGPWVGWSHHHWLVDVTDRGIEFVFKSAAVHGRPSAFFPAELAGALTPEERVQTMLWEGGFEFRERIFADPEELNRHLDRPVAEHAETLAARTGRRSPMRRLRGALRREA